MIEPGSRVAWNHAFYMHAPESVIYADSVPEGSPVGTVIGPANEDGSWLEVSLDSVARETLNEAGEPVRSIVAADVPETRVLTIDEVVRVKERV